MKKKFKLFLKMIFYFVTNPRLLICFIIGWMITNGWAYVMFGAGTMYQIEWMIAVSGTYLAFLWLPISPEKVVTFFIAMIFLKLLFPQDEKTLGVLKEFREKHKRKKEYPSDENPDNEKQ